MSLVGGWVQSESLYLSSLRPFPPRCSGVSRQVKSNYRMYRPRGLPHQATCYSWDSVVWFCLSTLVSLWGKVESSGLMKKSVTPAAYFWLWSQWIPFADGVGFTCCQRDSRQSAGGRAHLDWFLLLGWRSWNTALGLPSSDVCRLHNALLLCCSLNLGVPNSLSSSKLPITVFLWLLFGLY